MPGDGKRVGIRHAGGEDYGEIIGRVTGARAIIRPPFDKKREYGKDTGVMGIGLFLKTGGDLKEVRGYFPKGQDIMGRVFSSWEGH
jgi:hypothetical protein